MPNRRFFFFLPQPALLIFPSFFRPCVSGESDESKTSIYHSIHTGPLSCSRSFPHEPGNPSDAHVGSSLLSSRFCFYFMHWLCAGGLYTIVHCALRKPEILLLLRFHYETPQAICSAQKFGAPSRRACIPNMNNTK